MTETLVHLQAAGNQTEARSTGFLTQAQNSCKPNHKPTPVLRHHELSVNPIKAVPKEQSSHSGLSVCHGAVFVTAAHNRASYLCDLSLKSSAETIIFCRGIFPSARGSDWQKQTP